MMIEIIKPIANEATPYIVTGIMSFCRNGAVLGLKGKSAQMHTTSKKMATGMQSRRGISLGS